MVPHMNTYFGDENALASEFVRKQKENLIKLNTCDLQAPRELEETNILAVHYADGGAQGDAGAVEILYFSNHNVQVLYGNYCYGNLDLNEVICKLPMLKSLDSRYSFEPPYPFGGSLTIPEGWNYLYMGAMNHFFVREGIAEKASTFLKIVQKEIGSWIVFDAIAWLCGAGE